MSVMLVISTETVEVDEPRPTADSVETRALAMEAARSEMVTALV